MFRGLLLSLCLLAFPLGAFAQAAPAPASAAPAAAPVADPYAATVPVAGTSDAQRNDAIAAAFNQVLQQVSPGFVASPDLVAKAAGWVRSARYRRAASGQGLELQVEFDSGAVGRALAAAPPPPPATSAPPGSSASPPPVPVGGSGSLWVDGIDSSHAFASLLATLRGNSALHDVTPIAASGDGVLLHLAFDQPLTTVLAALTGPAGHLAPAPQAHPGADASLHWLH